MRALLKIEAGDGEPRVWAFDCDHPATLGRHRRNSIVLFDEHASRRHAEVFHEEGQWFIRDFNPLNATRVDGQCIGGVARLADGQLINIGRTALRFVVQAPQDDIGKGPGNATESPSDPPPVLSTDFPQLEETALCQDELDVLCRFMATSVKQTEPLTLVRLALETIHKQVDASVTGFLSLDPQTPLPKVVLPHLDRVDIHLSRQLTQEVEKLGRSVWRGCQPDALADSESLLSFADALCVPLVASGAPLGALHVYKAARLLTEREIRFCEILAGHLASCLHLLRAQRSLKAENSRLRSHSPAAEELVGSGAVLESLRQRIARLAPGPSTILIVGESGAGKELVALALHRLSPRREGPLVSVNCASIAPSLLESELFGHRRGAFSGADRDHQGLFQQAEEGTLFLDEVGELSVEFQAKLLRVLETKRFRPVGAENEVQVDVRILAATHRDLAREVETGRFRQDLFFRLQGIQIAVPPLREHLDDLPELVEHFLEKLAVEWGRPVRLSAAAISRLREYAWPGNVRQLRSFLENVVALADKNLIEPQDLPLPHATSGGDPPTLKLDDLEAWAIQRALERTDGNITRAARILGIARDTLNAKMKKYEIRRSAESE
jgi:two-component system, NtrC family, response regulator HydG